MSYHTKQAKRYFDNSTKREDARNAIDATANMTEDEAQAIADALNGVEFTVAMQQAILAASDCPEVKSLQRKMENIILDMRTELQTA